MSEPEDTGRPLRLLDAAPGPVRARGRVPVAPKPNLLVDTAAFALAQKESIALQQIDFYNQWNQRAGAADTGRRAGLAEKTGRS